MSQHRTAAITLFLALATACGQARALLEGILDNNLATSTWAGVVSITPSTGGTFSGALIDPWHVLTAAHVVYGNRNSPGNVVVNVNHDGNLSSVIRASQVAVHPSYRIGNTSADDGVFAWNDDLAVITLSRPVPAGVPTYGLYSGTPGLNGAPRTITMVAYGGWSDGVSAKVTTGSSPSIKRVGQNRIDDLGLDDEGGGQVEIFIFDFDGPDSSTNLIGGPTLGDDVEAGYAGGDSGSPVFIHDNGVWKIAGIGAFNGDSASIPGNAVQFGAFGGGMLVAPYVDWIQAQTALPVPVAETQHPLMMRAGPSLPGLAVAHRQRTGAVR